MEPAVRKPPPQLKYLIPAAQRATQYEEVTVHTQWSPLNHAAQGWFAAGADGRAAWSEQSTRLVSGNWWAYRDPAARWFRPYVEAQAAAEDAIELASESAARMNLLDGVGPAWREILATHYGAYRFPEYGLFLALCYAQREALSDVAAGPLVFQSLDKDRHSQAIALYVMDLDLAWRTSSDGGKQAWMEDPVWQPMRRYVELLIACRDWGEIAVAVNLLHEPIAATLFTREFIARFAPHQGDAVTPVIVETVDSDRRIATESTIELMRMLVAESDANRAVIGEWIEKWSPLALESARALAPLFQLPERAPLSFEQAFEKVRGEAGAMLTRAGVDAAPLGRSG